MIQWVTKLILLGICSIAAWKDWHSRRIPNSLILFSLKLIGIVILNELIISQSWLSFLERLLAGFLFMFLHWILYYSGNMGAGDVKLALVIGLFLGWTQWTAFLSYYGLVLGAVSLLLVIRHKKNQCKALPLAPIMGLAYLLFLLH